MSPTLKRRLGLFVAGISGGAVLALFARVVLWGSTPLEVSVACPDCAGSRAPRIPPSPSEEGHVRLGPPARGEWRDLFPQEKLQSFEDYLATGANRKCAHRGTLYLQPLATPPGRRSFAPGAHERYERAVALMREYGEIFFSVPVKILEPIPMFEETYDKARGQCDASAILDRLVERMPKDALVYIGITEDDLWADRLNFVFGLGSLARRTGVYSLRRYDSKDETLFFRRSLKLMAHEVGHIFSIEHCVTWRCVMQGANTLAEDDSHPMYLCPIDLRKLEWNTGFDRAERTRMLLDFYRRMGFKEDAAWAAERSKKPLQIK